MKRTISAILIFSFLIGFFSPQEVMAQTASVDGQEIKHSNGPRRQLATIVFAGLGGAVLGLSTLSFYGRPQDNLVNIAMGFAVGVIAGTVYVTFKSVSTRDYYDQQDGKKSGSNLMISPFVTESQYTHTPEGAGAKLTLDF